MWGRDARRGWISGMGCCSKEVGMGKDAAVDICHSVVLRVKTALLFE